MRRKSTRNASVKTSPDKSKEEKPTKSTARKSTRRRKQSTSGTGSESESEGVAPATQIETIIEEPKPISAEVDTDWNVAQTDSQCSTEIRKIKINLSRPLPSTPERTSRRLRKKSVSIPDEELIIIEDKPTRRTRRGRGASPKREEPNIDESEEEEAEEEKKGKGKSKGKTKSKLDRTRQISETETQTELCKNVQVTSQSPNIDQVDNIDDDADYIETDSKQNEDDKIILIENAADNITDSGDNNESDKNEPPELSPDRTEDSNDNIVEEMHIDNIIHIIDSENDVQYIESTHTLETELIVSTNEVVVTSKDVDTEVISQIEDINKAHAIDKNAGQKCAEPIESTTKKVLDLDKSSKPEITETTAIHIKLDTEKVEDCNPDSDSIEEKQTGTEKIEEPIVVFEKVDDKMSDIEKNEESKDNAKIEKMEVGTKLDSAKIIESTKTNEKEPTQRVRQKKPSRFDQREPSQKVENNKILSEEENNVTDNRKLSKSDENVSLVVEKVIEKASTLEDHKHETKFEEKEHKRETKVEEKEKIKKSSRFDVKIPRSDDEKKSDKEKNKSSSNSDEKVTEKERIKITFKSHHEKGSLEQDRPKKSSRFDVKEVYEKDKTKKIDKIKESPDKRKSTEEKPERERVKITFKKDDKSASEKIKVKKSDEKARTTSTDDEKRVFEKDNVRKSSRSDDRIKISFKSDDKGSEREKHKKVSRFDVKEPKKSTRFDVIESSKNVEISKSTRDEDRKVSSEKDQIKETSDNEKTPEIDRKMNSDTEATDKNDEDTPNEKIPEVFKTVIEEDNPDKSEEGTDNLFNVSTSKQIKTEDKIESRKSGDFAGFENDSDVVQKEADAETKMEENDAENNMKVPEVPLVPREIIRTKKWGTKATGLSTFNLLEVNVTTISEIYPELGLVDESEVNFDEIPQKSRRRSSAISEHEPRSKERKVSIEERPEKYARQTSERETSERATPERPTSESDSKEEAIAHIPINDNIIAMNRKISIVEDSAGKLKTPPSPARHELSEVLFISNLVRPFTLKQLRELLERTGKLKEDGFWTDRIKSKCYVCYETSEQAEATRNALHGVHWPIGNGKKLMIDYATPEDIENAKNPPAPIPVKVPEAPQKENKEPDRESMNRTKEEVEDEKEREEQRKSNPHVREWDMGKDNAVPKRRSSRSRDRGRERSPKRRRSRSRRTRSPSDDFIKRKQKKIDDAVPQRAMDDLFRKTVATPCIYWQPLAPEEIAMKQQQRMERMEEHKRRMAHTTFASNRGGNRGSDHLRGGPYRRRY